MASQTNSYAVPDIEVTGHPITPPSSSPLRRWWSRPIVTYPASNDRKPTWIEFSATATPGCGGLLSVIAVYYLFFTFLNEPLSHAKFSIQSINVSSPSDMAMWHVDFLVKNPSSRYSIYYDGDDASVRLGPLNAALLNVSHRRVSSDVTALSLAYVAEEKSVYDVRELDVKFSGKQKSYVSGDTAGHFNVRCQNLTRSHENNVDKFICQTSFTYLDTFCYL